MDLGPGGVVLLRRAQVGLGMGLLSFQNRPASGPEIIDLCGLNGPKPVQHPYKMVGREAWDLPGDPQSACSLERQDSMAQSWSASEPLRPIS